MNSIVIYKSNTGFTKKYAMWIAQALSCDAIALESAKALNLDNYDTIVFGGWFFAGSIQGLKEFKGHLLDFKGKAAVFVTGAMPSGSPAIESSLNKGFPKDERENIGIFYMRGGLNYETMGFIHKSMMKMMCAVMKKEKGIDSIEYTSISTSFDATDKANIGPIIDYIMK